MTRNNSLERHRKKLRDPHELQNHLKGKFIKLMIVLLMAQCIVIPHSLQTITAATLFITFLVAMYRLLVDRNLIILAIDYWLPINLLVNLIYIFVGLNNNAYEGFIPIVMVQNIIAPFLWVWIAKAMYIYFSEKEIIRSFYWLSIIGALSVGLFFYLFLNFGAFAVEFWIDKDLANVQVSGGQVAATMIIYGSFIFSSAAFMSSPELVRSMMLRVLILFLIFIIAVTSGRAALMISIAIGGFTGIVIKSLNKHSYHKSKKTVSTNKYIIIALVSLTLDNLVDKLSQGGGDSRVWQFDALLRGINDTNGLGAGHGVGVHIIRSAEHPWRYELTPLATIFRVGIIGFFLLMIPYIYYVAEFLKRMSTSGVDSFDTFMFSGFVAFIVASFTNPYPESFIFQFSLYIPIVLFEMKYRRQRGTRSTASIKHKKLNN